LEVGRTVSVGMVECAVCVQNRGCMKDLYDLQSRAQKTTIISYARHETHLANNIESFVAEMSQAN
jgi:hypothetical protein